MEMSQTDVAGVTWASLPHLEHPLVITEIKWKAEANLVCVLLFFFSLNYS